MRNFVIVFFLLVVCDTSAQNGFSADSIHAFHQKLNLQFADSLTSPLQKQDLAQFSSLDFFEPNPAFHVKAKLIRSHGEKPFAMPTTTDRRPMYIKFGELHFSIHGQQFQLNVYQNVSLPRNPLYKDNLFLPFTDMTSGVTTYGGGRYIDLKIPEDDILIIDFNKAYNPYCAYNPQYSCPLVPPENDLNIEILAGVKKFHE